MKTRTKEKISELLFSSDEGNRRTGIGLLCCGEAKLSAAIAFVDYCRCKHNLPTRHAVLLLNSLLHLPNKLAGMTNEYQILSKYRNAVCQSKALGIPGERCDFIGILQADFPIKADGKFCALLGIKIPLTVKEKRGWISICFDEK
jgi:hypothetical protein